MAMTHEQATHMPNKITPGCRLCHAQPYAGDLEQDWLHYSYDEGGRSPIPVWAPQGFWMTTSSEVATNGCCLKPARGQSHLTVEGRHQEVTVSIDDVYRKRTERTSTTIRNPSPVRPAELDWSATASWQF